MSLHYTLSEHSKKMINDYFMDMYDFKQWFFKVKTNVILLENTEKFVELLGDKEIKDENIESYKLTLKSEMVFTFYHMAESLFSLMYCVRYSELPWLAMKHLRFKEICNYVKDEIVTDKISDEDIRFIFYNGIFGDNAKKSEVQESIKFIRDFLKRMGAIFLDNEIYMEYKHGLRIMTYNTSLSITPENVPNPKTHTLSSGTSHTYLKTALIKKNGKEENHSVSQRTIGFDYNLYVRLCCIILRLIDNLFNTRRQAKKLKPEEKMLVVFFHKESINDIFKVDSSHWSELTINYP